MCLCFLPSLKRGMGFGWDIDIVEKDKEGKCPWRIAASATPPPYPKPPPHPANGVDGWSVLAFPSLGSPAARHQNQGSSLFAMRRRKVPRMETSPDREDRLDALSPLTPNISIHPTKKTGNLFL